MQPPPTAKPKPVSEEKPLIDLPTLEQLEPKKKRHTDWVKHLCEIPFAGTIAVGSLSGKVALWDIATGMYTVLFGVSFELLMVSRL